MNPKKPISKENPLPKCCSRACYEATSPICNCKCKGKFHAAAILPFMATRYFRTHLTDLQHAQLAARNHRRSFVPTPRKSDLPGQQVLPIIDAVDYI